MRELAFVDQPVLPPLENAGRPQASEVAVHSLAMTLGVIWSEEDETDSLEIVQGDLHNKMVPIYCLGSLHQLLHFALHNGASGEAFQV